MADDRWGEAGHPREMAAWFREEADHHGAMNVDTEEMASFMDLYAKEFDKLEAVKLPKTRRERLILEMVAYIDYETWKTLFQGKMTDDTKAKLAEMDEIVCRHLKGP